MGIWTLNHCVTHPVLLLNYDFPTLENTNLVEGPPCDIGLHKPASAYAYLPLSACLRRGAEEIVQDGEVIAEERRFLLHNVLLQQRRHLIPKESLVVLPDLPLHLHRTHLIQFLICHHLLQLLLWDLVGQEEEDWCRMCQTIWFGITWGWGKRSTGVIFWHRTSTSKTKNMPSFPYKRLKFIRKKAN